MELGKQTREEAMEQLRQYIVKHAKHGAIAAVNMTTHVPDWKEPLAEQDDTFDVNLIFDFQKLRKDKNYLKILKEGENTGEDGNVGYYFIKEEFQLVLIYSYKDDEHMN